MELFKVFVCVVGLVGFVTGLDNGLALTPPMGWMHWERFRCITDCEAFPDECISEDLFRSMADRMAKDGYLEAGYEYVIIDDCWMARDRDPEGKLQPDPDRFPNGIKALADYIHAKGLKFGIYADFGTHTCAGYPGSIDDLELDAHTFADWGVDYLKLDGCYADVTAPQMEEGYAEMGRYLNNTGRPIVFSCSFPAYEGLEKTNYTAAAQVCNLWRNYGDIQDSWASVTDIATWFGTNGDYLSTFSGPGHWNDPDMLIIGNYGLSLEQSKSQMTIWSILSAPLIMSVDLRTIPLEFKEILLSKYAIQINRDENMIPGKLLGNISDIQIWSKPVSPVFQGELSYALGFVSYRDDGSPYKLDFQLKDLGITNEYGYLVDDIFGQSQLDGRYVLPGDDISVRVPPSGAVFLRLTVVKFKTGENPDSIQ